MRSLSNCLESTRFGFFLLRETVIFACGFFSIRYTDMNVARFPSGQRGRTVNPLVYAFVGSNPTLATIVIKGEI